MTTQYIFSKIKMKFVQLSNYNCNFNGKEFYRNYQLLSNQKKNVLYRVTLSYVKLENHSQEECEIVFTQPKISFPSLNKNCESKSQQTFYTDEDNILTFEWIYFNILVGSDKIQYTGKWEIELIIEEV